MRMPRVLLITLAFGLAGAVAGCGSDGPLADIDVTRPSGDVTLPQVPTTGTPDTTEAPTTTAATEPTDPNDPTTTESPTTEAPTTEAPTTEAPTTEAPAETTEPAAEPAPVAAAEDEETSWLPWVLVALGLALIVAIIVAVRKGKSGPSWDGRVANALAEAQHRSSKLVQITPDGASAIASDYAAALATLGVELRRVAEDAPDPGRRAAIDRVQGQTELLHGVVDSIALGPVPASAPAMDYLHEQASILHSMAGQARAEVAPPA